ncbi:vitellogenic carboxypeptidase-like [Ostrinia nubilalis]|uniref:vitellogenic carboxypeptidase-like n=1 Tax=Ostrinia nubilalis TaxID=29057 RepID=UPI00308261E2
MAHLSYYNILIFNILHLTYCETFGGTILTPYIQNGSYSMARKLSTVDSKNFLGIKSHSGFMTVKKEYDSNIFFWYFPHERSAEKPWVIWLQGGPGFSSLVGLFHGVGPLKIEDSKVNLQKGTWANDYSLLFVDNPVGAGFSYTRDDRGYTSGQDEIGEQLLEFLVQFLQVFSELQDAPLFIAGQSYSGKYVPTLGLYIHRYRSKGGRINLKVCRIIDHSFIVVLTLVSSAIMLQMDSYYNL